MARIVVVVAVALTVVAACSGDYPPLGRRDVNCSTVGHRVGIDEADPYGLDADADGIGCDDSGPDWILTGLLIIGLAIGSGIAAASYQAVATTRTGTGMGVWLGAAVLTALLLVIGAPKRLSYPLAGVLIAFLATLLANRMFRRAPVPG